MLAHLTTKDSHSEVTKLSKVLPILQIWSKSDLFMPRLAIWHSCHTGHEQNAAFGDFISRSKAFSSLGLRSVGLFWQDGFCAKKNCFSHFARFWSFLSDSQWGESYSGDIWSDGTFIDNVYGSLFSLFFLFWIKGFWIQVYHLVDSTIFSGPANCVTSYDMTSHGKSGNLLTLS